MSKDYEDGYAEGQMDLWCALIAAADPFTFRNLTEAVMATCPEVLSEDVADHMSKLLREWSEDPGPALVQMEGIRMRHHERGAGDPALRR